MKKIILIAAMLVGAVVLIPSLVEADKEGKPQNPPGRSVAERVRLYRTRLAVGRMLIEVQASNWPAVIRYYTDDIEYHDPIVDISGIEDMSEFLARLFTSSSNLVTTVEDENCVNGVYMAAWTMIGDFNGVPYTAKGMSTIKFVPGQAMVCYQRDYYTEGDIMKNIPARPGG